MPFYTFPHREPRVVEKGRETTLTQSVESGATVATVISGTFTLYNENNAKVVDGAAVTISDGVASYTLSAGDTSSADYSDAWLEEWSLTITGGTVLPVFRRDLAVVRRVLYPTVTDSDLLDLHDDLNRLAPSDQTSWEDKRRQAFYDVQDYLMQSGRRPWLVMSSRVLRQAELYRTLELIYRSFSGMPGGRNTNYPDLAKEYGDKYEAELASLNLERYDYRETGELADAVEDTPLQGVVFTSYIPSRGAY